MIDYSENLKKGNLESLKLVSRLLTGTAIIVDQCGYEKISKDKLVSFLIEMSDSIANYVYLLDASENVS